MSDAVRDTRSDRNVSLALVAAMAIEGAGALLWAGAAAERIAHLEYEVAAVAQVNERLARLEAQGSAMGAQLDRIEARLDPR